MQFQLFHRGGNVPPPSGASTMGEKWARMGPHAYRTTRRQTNSRSVKSWTG